MPCFSNILFISSEEVLYMMYERQLLLPRKIRHAAPVFLGASPDINMKTVRQLRWREVARNVIDGVKIHDPLTDIHMHSRP